MAAGRFFSVQLLQTVESGECDGTRENSERSSSAPYCSSLLLFSGCAAPHGERQKQRNLLYCTQAQQRVAFPCRTALDGTSLSHCVSATGGFGDTRPSSD